MVSGDIEKRLFWDLRSYSSDESFRYIFPCGGGKLFEFGRRIGGKARAYQISRINKLLKIPFCGSGNFFGYF